MLPETTIWPYSLSAPAIPYLGLQGGLHHPWARWVKGVSRARAGSTKELLNDTEADAST